jgi:hypothetical protein
MKPIPDTQPTIPIADIRVGTRHRRDMGDIAELAANIGEIGLLHPIPIRPDRSLIAGARRLAACNRLGWTHVPVHIVDLEQIVRGEFAENAYRKKFLPTEIYAIWQALEPIERAAAKERMLAGKPMENFHRGATRDKVAACAGISGRTLDKIAAVVEAAEADPRLRPLVDQMDQTGHVHGAFQQLEAAKAEALRQERVKQEDAKRPIQISVAAWNAAFPKYPPIFEHGGCVYGVWLTGTAWHKSRLHGEYPPTFLKRALALFPGARQVLHCPSGTVMGPGITVDRIRDKVRCPQIVADAAALPLQSGTIDLVLADPPYTDEDSKVYGCAPFPQKKFMSEAHRVLRRGGYLGVLHLYLPSYRNDEWKVVATICVMTAPCRAPRVFSIFERL